jgi:hypothetical protein
MMMFMLLLFIEYHRGISIMFHSVGFFVSEVRD